MLSERCANECKIIFYPEEDSAKIEQNLAQIGVNIIHPDTILHKKLDEVAKKLLPTRYQFDRSKIQTMKIFQIDAEDFNLRVILNSSEVLDFEIGKNPSSFYDIPPEILLQSH